MRHCSKNLAAAAERLITEQPGVHLDHEHHAVHQCMSHNQESALMWGCVVSACQAGLW